MREALARLTRFYSQPADPDELIDLFGLDAKADARMKTPSGGHAHHPLGEYTIDLLQSNTEPKFATIDARPERTEEHLAAIGVVCVHIKQVVRGFIAGITGQPALLSTLVTVDVDEVDISLQGE